MRSIVLTGLFVCAAFAQQPPQAAEEALRARVNEFYQDHVTEQYRKAEKLVAEDSQDIFYVREKPKYEGFEIKQIEWRDNFQKARVTVTVQVYGKGEGFSGQRLKTPSLSYWKLVDGQWFWYADPEELNKVGFGPSKNAGTRPLPGQEIPKVVIATDTSMAMGKVAIDKERLTVKPGGEDTITITNNSQGTVGVMVYQILPDIKVTLDKTTLDRGEKAVAKIECGENPHKGELQFMVTPTNEVLSVRTTR